MLVGAIDFKRKEAKELFHQIYTDNCKLAYDILHNKEDAEDAVQASFVSLAESFERKERIRYVKWLLEKLPASSKDIMILKYYYGLSYSEISKIIGLSSKTVAMKVYRAKLKIREVMENEDDFGSLEEREKC